MLSYSAEMLSCSAERSNNINSLRLNFPPHAQIQGKGQINSSHLENMMVSGICPFEESTDTHLKARKYLQIFPTFRLNFDLT
jgi:hypothetical protein